MKIIFAALFVIVFSISLLAQAKNDSKNNQKLSPEDVISKHLASIGTPEARTATRSRVLVGQAVLSSKVGYSGRLGGPAQFASDSNKLLLAMIFNSNEYKYEKLAFDGKEITYGRPRGNQLTVLGEFVKTHPTLIKQGLFGGALSTTWILENWDAKRMKAEYAGQETLDGKTFHKLRLKPPGSGELRVDVYFDVNSYQHVLTHYRYTIQPYLATSDITENSRAKAQHFSLTEQFSDFKKVGDLVLPLGYSISISNLKDGVSEELTWSMKFQQAYFNEPLEASEFKVS